MHFRRDLIPLPKDFAFDFFITYGRNAAVDPVLHFHDCLELNYIIEGTGTNYIENTEYILNPGDFYVINNLEHHMAVSNGNLKMKVIVFNPKLIWQNNSLDYDYLKSFYSRGMHFSNRVGKDNPLAPEILHIFGKIESEWNLKLEGYKMVIKALLMELLALLYRHFKASNSLDEDVLAFHRGYDRLRDVLQYINANPGKDFTLEELSSISLMNKTYFSAYFKKVMNVTVFEYIKNLRIDYACMLLKTTVSNITDIALECGFKSVTHFNRIFKEHTHFTPNEFRAHKT